MTTTSVKGVGSVMNLGAAAPAPAGKTAENGFQNVWNTQTGKGTSAAAEGPDAGQPAKEASKTEDSAKPGDDLRAKDTDRGRVKTESGKASENKAPEEMSEEELEEVMEVMATAAEGLIRQIADTFGMPVEEVQELMTELNLQPADLLQPENLSSLLLEAGGAQDSMALLTDEQLYIDFQALMEQGKTALEQVGQELQMTPEQLTEVMKMTEAATAAEEPAALQPVVEEPVIEVTVRTEEAEPEAKPVQQNTDVQGIDTVQTSAVNEKETAAQGNTAENGRSGGREQTGHRQPEGSPILQEIRNEQFQPRMENVQEPAGTWSADTQDIMRQVMDYLRIQIKSDVSNLEMQLHPASLGTLQVQVASKGGVLTANFVTQNEAVKAALESQMIQLKESFEQQGVKVEAIEVTVQTHQFEENLEQGQNRQSQEPDGRRNRTRRINLNGPDDLSGTGEFEEADQLAAEMLAAGGGTVDYTA